MAKIRLTHSMRNILLRHLANSIKPKEQLLELENAYSKAEPLVRKAVEAKCPPKDMKILAKYQIGGIDDCIKVRMPSGEVEKFDFRNNTGPYVAKLTYQNQIYLVDEPTAEAVQEWVNAKEAYDDEYQKRFKAYEALIHVSTTVEDLAQVWPEAATIIPSSNLPIALGPEEMDVIRNDVQERSSS